MDINIDYSRIITDADKRKDVLQQLVTHCANMEAVTTRLEETARWVDDLSTLFGLLDDEGRRLLPPAVHQFCAYRATTYASLHDAYKRFHQCLVAMGAVKQ